MKKSNLFVLFCFFAVFNSSAQRIAAGISHTVAICSDSTLIAWGNGSSGELGDGTSGFALTPVSVLGLNRVVAISAGHKYTLALTKDSIVWAWGDNNSGQLGNGNNLNSSIPDTVNLLNQVIAISAGPYHSLALKSDSTVWAWGWNSYGELGDGTMVSRNVPVQVSSLTGVTAVSSAQYHSLALKSDGTVWSWGNNAEGELGTGWFTSSTIPVQVYSLTDIIAISAGETHSLALKNDGTVWAWGMNNGAQLGNGTYTDSPIAVAVSGLTEVVAIDATLALKSDGTLWAWGRNIQGQACIGWGTPSLLTIPVQTYAPLGIVSFLSGYLHCMILKNDGTLWGWGYNEGGQIGDSTFTNRYFPSQTLGTCPVSTQSYCLAHYTTAYDSLMNTFILNVDSATTAIAVSYFWDFGDGTTSTLANPSHTYTVDTIFNVCMKIATAAGDSCTYCHKIGKDYTGNIIRGGGEGFTLNVQNPNITTTLSEPVILENKILVSPNPSNGIFNIVISHPLKNASIEMYNSLGVLIQKQKITNQESTIELCNQSKGLYFVKVMSDNKIIGTRKIIKE